jgi:hypothetical protein
MSSKALVEQEKMDKEYTQLPVFEQERIHDFLSDVLHQLSSNVLCAAFNITAE